jgi:hypothetical protein
MRRAVFMIVFALFAVAVPQVAEACPVCYGDIDGPVARGVNNGIMAMLGIVFMVQFGFVALFVGMWRRSKRLQAVRESLTVIKGGRS